jgi:hypothetical protein
MMPEQALQQVKVARFACLPETQVVEHWTFTQDELLSWLEKKPTQKWRGTHGTPGWSPVLYDPMERAKENIKHVYGLVLDYDKGKPTFEAVAHLWRNFYGLVYTTKSHDIDSNRLRAVLPLSRPISPDEYDRLWQWAEQQARNVDLKTDGQAKDASRFWYVPTPPDNDTWRSLRLTGSVLDVDATLPLVDKPSLRVMPMPEIVTDDIKVERARRYLSKIPGAVSGDAGHTRTFNAFAHVHIGFDIDIDTTLSIIQSDYNPRCDPPWSERELLHKAKSVAMQCKRERGYLLQVDRRPIYSTQQASDKATPLPSEHDIDWRAGCAYKKDNVFKRAYVNIVRLVGHHPDYRNRWSLNQMTGEVWFDGAPMLESLIHSIRERADHILGYTVAPSDVQAAIQAAAEMRQFHPIQQYLRSVDWDGVERLSAMARDFLGTDSSLHAEMVRRWMIGAAARALRPGCKLDTALMLFGEQGFFKSTFFAVLGGDWHADSFIDISNKDSFVQLHSAWIYEFSELENVVTGRSESRLKAWLTSTHDMYRAPYAKTAVRRARSVALAGTTNRQQILTDDTGSRRFWIVPVKRPVDVIALADVRDQLWAEAVCAVEAGESWWLDAGLERDRESANENFADEDPWHETIAAWLSKPSVTEVTIAEVLREALELDASRQDHWALRRAGRVLKRLGWIRTREADGDRRWKYVRPGTQIEVSL